MLRYVIKRVLISIPLLFALSILVFFYVQAVPGDPIAGMLGPAGTPETIERIREERGLNRPLWDQYWSWLGGFLTGNFGVSLISGQNITPIVVGRIPATLQLTAAGLIMIIAIGFPLGYYAGKNKGSWLDRIFTPVTLFGVSLPQFWVGTILVLIFSVQLGWFPSGGYVPLVDNPAQSLRLTVLPALVLGITLSPLMARLVRISTAKLQTEQFVVQARIRGLLPRTIAKRYLLRNAVLPVLVILGMQLGTLIGGQVVVEQLFNYPGLGRLLVEGAIARDYLMIQSLIFLIAIIYVVINLTVEILHAWLDPRVRL